MASPATSEGQGIQRHTSPANHRIPHILDALRGKKTRSRLAQRLPFGSVLMAGTAPEVDIFAGGAVIMAAMAAAKVINRLSERGFRRESGSGDDNLAVFVLVSGVGGLESRHFYRGMACLVNQAARSSSLRLPSARWRKVKYVSSLEAAVSQPFLSRKVMDTTRGIRLLPSMNA